jgi:hypothetical protein
LPDDIQKAIQPLVRKVSAGQEEPELSERRRPGRSRRNRQTSRGGA